ncbi:MAG: hypothetical protein NTY47_02375 [Candidatus Omnitrophica bacterium]|nr:hypothetical protein [Candidatus Omnitrophota bacterium]
MAEETKKECGCGCGSGSKMAGTLAKVVIGLVFLVLGILALIRWLPALLIVGKGCIGLVLILAGIVTLAIAKD